MTNCTWFSTLGLALVLVVRLSGVNVVCADDEKKDGKVSGIMIDKKDDWITVKADGEDEPIKYFLPKTADKKLNENFKSAFNACRVQLTYMKDGDTRQLTSIKRQINKTEGTMTGTVVKVYNDFWVEVKPKEGVNDAFAPGRNYNDKEFMAKLRGLKAGDTVTIKYNTDFERHRILSMQVIEKKEKEK